MKQIRVRWDGAASARVDRYIHILGRHLAERSETRLEQVSAGQNADLMLDIQSGIGTEGFSITEGPKAGINVTGNEELGLLHGIGQYLHTGSFKNGEFTPGSWRGASVPQTTMRGMYFALHDNWYSKAPLQSVQNYVEDLTLWGLNSLALHLQQYEDRNSPEARENFARDHSIVKSAKELGIKVGLLKVPNLGFEQGAANLPPELLAPEFPDTDPPRRGYAGIRICPSIPEGFRYLSHKLDDYLSGFEDVGIDYVVSFPYDSGGCGCDKCWPWGARGYLTISKEFSRIARAKYPGCQFVLGTWCYDVREESDGEYEGLERVLAEDSIWVDYIMADSHEEFPEYPLRPGSLAGLPIINFGEISMWGRFPWGGSGANPLPARFQRIWDESGLRLDGGLPYSEGRFEDINKVIFIRFFWDKCVTSVETVSAYIRYEFGNETEEPLMEALYLLEKTYPQWEREKPDVLRAYELITDVDEKLSPQARAAWRWQIIYLRAIIDYEREMHDGQVTNRCDEAYDKLVEIMDLQDGWSCVTPPSRAYKERRRIAEMDDAELPPGAEPERDAEARAALSAA